MFIYEYVKSIFNKLKSNNQETEPNNNKYKSFEDMENYRLYNLLNRYHNNKVLIVDKTNLLFNKDFFSQEVREKVFHEQACEKIKLEIQEAELDNESTLITLKKIVNKYKYNDELLEELYKIFIWHNYPEIFNDILESNDNDYQI